MAKRAYANQPPATTLVTTGGVNSSVTSLAPSTTTGWPVPATDGEFAIKIDQEIMLVTAFSTPNWTVARGQEGTTAVSHSEGAQIRHPQTKLALLRLAIQSLAGTIVGSRRELNFLQTGNVQWTLTDDPTNEKMDIKADVSVLDPGERAVVTPVLSQFTTDVSAAAGSSITQQTGYILFSSPVMTADKCIIAYKTAPATPYSIIAKMHINSLSEGFVSAGIMFRDGSTGRMHRMVHQMNDRKVYVDRYTNNTTFSLADKNVLVHGMLLYPWFKIRDNGTNFIFSMSVDGTNWFDLVTIARTTFVATPDQVGMVINVNSGSGNPGAMMKILGWEQTA